MGIGLGVLDPSKLGLRGAFKDLHTSISTATYGLVQAEFLCSTWSSAMRVSPFPTGLGYVGNTILGDTQAFLGGRGGVGIPHGGSGS